MSAPDVLVVSVGATTGWRAAARELAAGLARAGAQVQPVDTGPVATVRTFMLTDFVQALAARRSTARALAGAAGAPDFGGRAPAIVYCSMTAALLWPRPGAIWLDSLALENRPGRHGVWQRQVEIRRLAAAPLILTMAENSLAPLGAARPPHVDPVVIPVAVEPSGPVDGVRDIDVLAYTGDPVKRRLDFILAAWERARRDGETLVVAGIERPASAPPGVRFVGRLGAVEYRALVRRARVYVAAPVREDFGIAPLEALADGCQLVTTPAPGPYVALGLARRLDARLVGDDLVPALRHALDDPRPDYGARAAELMAPFRRAAVDEAIATRVLPRLLAPWAPA